MTVLLQISDPHFGTEVPAVAAALQRFVKQLAPDAMIWSGDITQRARRAQFEAARRFADALNVPQRLVIPGNHDIPLFNLAARIAWPYRGFERAFGPLPVAPLALPGALVIGVKTTRRWRHKHGQLSAEQVAEVAVQLHQARPGQLRIVVLHQPLHVGEGHDHNNQIRGAAAAIEAWAAAGADLVLGGHIHLPYHCQVKDGVRPLWVVQAGTALSSRVRAGAPNSVNVLQHDPARQPGFCWLARWDYSAEADAFKQLERVPLALDRGGRGVAPP
ncbi:MAG TPA: metallophosphoesterase [Ideonella sp.]|uniref:metallophosphoesterase family protein n=1 Tax=Ideonella sp. TaxID=1929293 RepID=UPI002C3AF251|nr:metallophosphoesterase [Ideonella sp.]HSI49864.1 metallophosphoesterase [Ideonella sp.]